MQGAKVDVQDVGTGLTAADLEALSDIMAEPTVAAMGLVAAEAIGDAAGAMGNRPMQAAATAVIDALSAGEMDGNALSVIARRALPERPRPGKTTLDIAAGVLLRELAESCTGSAFALAEALAAGGEAGLHEDALLLLARTDALSGEALHAAIRRNLVERTAAIVPDGLALPDAIAEAGAEQAQHAAALAAVGLWPGDDPAADLSEALTDVGLPAEAEPASPALEPAESVA